MIKALNYRELALLILLTMVNSKPFSAANHLDGSRALRDAITLGGIRAHQSALQTIAEQNGLNRMAITAGYKASVHYVQATLETAGFTVTLQEFPLTISKDETTPQLIAKLPDPRVFLAGVDFASMMAVGTAAIQGQVEAVDLKIPSISPNSSTSGCEEEDFSGFTPGNIALMQRGTCEFHTKVENAIKAGASAAIIFNEGNVGRTELISTQLATSKADFPIIGTSFLVGDTLRAGKLHGVTGIDAFVKVDVGVSTFMVENVIAETEGGDDKRIVVIGAHLDSVSHGPGINDNGSGSSAILEFARQYQALQLTPQNKLRFIWFGAEEFGLLGSEFYVNSLSAGELQKIIAMLNFDMLGSPNYARFVYDGDNSGKTEDMAVVGPDGSDYIERIFLDYFSSANLASHPTAFNGRSDYGPFIEVGIPAGGLFSGAEGIKSTRLANIYGGTAGLAFDPCYHRACDDYARTGGNDSSSLALKSLDELADAGAHALFYLANTSDLVGKGKRYQKRKLCFEYRGNFLQR